MGKVFFSGLFMDQSLLTEKGLHPEVIGPAVLRDYRIHIGQRATLLRSASSLAYGIVMDLADQEARSLYADPSVREYVRERVQVELLETGESVEAYCYNLPPELALVGANPAYAAELSRLVEALGFDSAYVEEIAAFGEASSRSVQFRVAWRGQDLSDSIEEEGMTLGSRAAVRIAWEIVSSLRNKISTYVPEPSQEDSWASFEFSNSGQRVSCGIAEQEENEYSVTVGCAQGLLRSLFGAKAPPVDAVNIDLVREALSENPRFEILGEGDAG